jgi:hypothetical protein
MSVFLFLFTLIWLPPNPLLRPPEPVATAATSSPAGSPTRDWRPATAAERSPPASPLVRGKLHGDGDVPRWPRHPRPETGHGGGELHTGLATPALRAPRRRQTPRRSPPPKLPPLRGPAPSRLPQPDLSEAARATSHAPADSDPTPRWPDGRRRHPSLSSPAAAAAEPLASVASQGSGAGRCWAGASWGQSIVGPAQMGMRASECRQAWRQLVLSHSPSLLRGSLVDRLTAPLRLP